MENKMHIIPGPEEIKFNKWLDTQRKNGLTGFDVTVDTAIKNIKREDFFKDLNEFNEQIDTGNTRKIDPKELDP
jgi:hypothetical protein